MKWQNVVPSRVILFDIKRNKNDEKDTKKKHRKLKKREIDQLSKRIRLEKRAKLKSNQFGENLQINASFGLISFSE